MSLPNGFWQIDHVFGLDNYLYRPNNNPSETWNQVWSNDSPRDPNWNVFVEGVAVPLAQAPRNWRVMGGLIDHFPRTVWYGGPITRDWAPSYVKAFQDWAASLGMAYETTVVPVQPNAYPMPRYPSQNFGWYIANEVRPPTRYKLIRKAGQNRFQWVDIGFDTFKFNDFHTKNPNVL